MKGKLLIILLVSIFMITGCQKTDNEVMKVEENPIVTMEFENYGEIEIELYPNKAYNTVANFVNLIESKFYDNNAITRVQKGFVIQAGGIKEPSYTIEGEFNSNGFNNDIKHTEGVISMARTSDPNSASAQFFIVLDDRAGSSLDGEYAAFGKVTKGLDILHKIENDNTLAFDDDVYMLLKEKSYIKIKSAKVDTKGHTYKVKKYTN